MQLAALMYFNQFVSLSLKKKNQTPQKELTFYGEGKKKKKRQKGLDLEISSKCQASWSSKHKYQGSFLIVGTKMTKTNTVPQVPHLSSMCWKCRGLGNKLTFTAVFIPRNDHILGKFRSFVWDFLTWAKTAFLPLRFCPKCINIFYLFTKGRLQLNIASALTEINF